MKTNDSNTTKFKISKPDKFKKILNPLEKKFSIHNATEEAVKDMEERIATRDKKKSGTIILDSAHSESSIRKGIKENLITQSILHSLICLLFNEIDDDKYIQPYTKQSVIDFFETIQLEYNEPGSIKRFRKFFKQLKIPQKFGNNYKIEVDEKWNFSTSNLEVNIASNIDEEDNILHNFSPIDKAPKENEKNQKYKDEKSDDKEFIEELKETDRLRNNDTNATLNKLIKIFFKRIRKYKLILTPIIAIIGIVYFLISLYLNKEKTIIENKEESVINNEPRDTSNLNPEKKLNIENKMKVIIQNKDSAKIEQINNFNNVNEVNL